MLILLLHKQRLSNITSISRLHCPSNAEVSTGPDL